MSFLDHRLSPGGIERFLNQHLACRSAFGSFRSTSMFRAILDSLINPNYRTIPSMRISATPCQAGTPLFQIWSWRVTPWMQISSPLLAKASSIVFDNQSVFGTRESDRANDTMVDFAFEMVVDAPDEYAFLPIRWQYILA